MKGKSDLYNTAVGTVISKSKKSFIKTKRLIKFFQKFIMDSYLWDVVILAFDVKDCSVSFSLQTLCGYR